MYDLCESFLSTNPPAGVQHDPTELLELVTPRRCGAGGCVLALGACVPRPRTAVHQRRRKEDSRFEGSYSYATCPCFQSRGCFQGYDLIQKAHALNTNDFGVQKARCVLFFLELKVIFHIIVDGHHAE